MKTNLQNIKKGHESIDQYLQKIKDSYSQRFLLLVSISDEDIMILTLKGLPAEYNNVKAVIRGRESVLSMKELNLRLRNLLLKKLLNKFLCSLQWLSSQMLQVLCLLLLCHLSLTLLCQLSLCHILPIHLLDFMVHLFEIVVKVVYPIILFKDFLEGMVITITQVGFLFGLNMFLHSLVHIMCLLVKFATKENILQQLAIIDLPHLNLLILNLVKFVGKGITLPSLVASEIVILLLPLR